VAVLDAHRRPLANLRLSVTDRCNLRCQYCMPEADYLWLPREDILQFEEIDRLVDHFLALGVEKVRLTGGEPLLRRDLPELIRGLAAKPRIRDRRSAWTPCSASASSSWRASTRCRACSPASTRRSIHFPASRSIR
jgi:molybdenum cofactor biosynthesis enzyme MoaA